MCLFTRIQIRNFDDRSMLAKRTRNIYLVTYPDNARNDQGLDILIFFSHKIKLLFMYFKKYIGTYTSYHQCNLDQKFYLMFTKICGLSMNDMPNNVFSNIFDHFS